MLATEEDKAIIENEIKRNIKNNFFAGKETIVFGCTIYAKNIRDILKSYGIEINAFIDNSTKKAGKKCLGIEVYKPEEFLMPYKLGIVLIICSKYNHEMIEQVREMGYPLECILNIPIAESNNKKGDSSEIFETECKHIKNGYMFYKNILGKYSKGHFVFVCPYPGTGDIYMACSFLNEYLLQKQIDKYVMVVIGNSCLRTAKLFSITNIESATGSEIQDILKAWEFLGSSVMNLKPLLYWGWRTKRYLYADQYPQITFTEMFLYDVYGFENKVSRKLPDRKMESTFASQLFKKEGLPKGKTIIIAPYAGSFESGITMDMWKEVIDKLKLKGYTICTNCFGKNEIPISGTVPIIFPYEEAVNVLEYAGGFIAVRSGFCDIVSSAKCKMVIIYENGFNASRYEYFSLKKMGLNDKAEEIVVGEMFIEDIVDKF